MQLDLVRTRRGTVVLEHLEFEEILRRSGACWHEQATGEKDDRGAHGRQNETRSATRAERGIAAWK